MKSTEVSFASAAFRCIAAESACLLCVLILCDWLILIGSVELEGNARLQQKVSINLHEFTGLHPLDALPSPRSATCRALVSVLGRKRRDFRATVAGILVRHFVRIAVVQCSLGLCRCSALHDS